MYQFNARNCKYLGMTGGGGSDQFTASETFAPPPNILSEPCPSPPPPYSKPSYAHGVSVNCGTKDGNASLSEAVEKVYDLQMALIKRSG